MTKRIVQVLLTEEGINIVKLNTELDSEKLLNVLTTLNLEQQEEIERAFMLLSEAAKNVHSH